MVRVVGTVQPGMSRWSRKWKSPGPGGRGSEGVGETAVGKEGGSGDLLTSR